MRAVVLLMLALAAGFLLAGSFMAPEARADAIDDVFAPHVYSTYPSDGADACALDEQPIVVFDTDMLSSTINDDTFYMDHVVGRKWVGGVLVPIFTRVNTWVGYFTDRSFFLVLEEDLEPGTTYLVHLTGRILGRHKVTRAWTQLADTPYTWSFTTATPPRIVSRTPVPAATNVPLDQAMTIVFDQAVQSVSDISIFLERVIPGVRIKMPAEVTVDGEVVTLDPHDPLEPDSTYAVTVTDWVSGKAGGLAVEGAPVSWTFTTAGRPGIVSRTPAPGATDVPLGQEVSIEFDRAVSGVDVDSVYLQRVGDAGKVICDVRTGLQDRAVVLDPAVQLVADTTYSVTITPAVTGSVGGLSLEGAPVSWKFSTVGDHGTWQGVFSDVPSGHIYHDAIYGMRQAGIIDGYQVGDIWEFRPDDTLYRAQFAKMVCGVMGLEVAEEDWPDPAVPFTDLGEDVLPGPEVINSLYPHEYVAVAYRNHITGGLTAANFAPYDRISRGQVATMLVRAADTLNPGLLLSPPTGYGTLGDFDPTHGPNLRKAEYNGLLAGLAGFGSSWDPWAFASRGETAQMLWNLMALLE